MEAIAYLDTHVVAWLYAGRTELFPPKTREILSNHLLRVSPILTLELSYLKEIGRLNEGPETVLPALYGSLGLLICDCQFSDVARKAWSMTWTRDPFDRMITAQASLGGHPLVTKDRLILEHYQNSVWD